MAYIKTEEVKAKRDRLKKEFPQIKFSVTREHYSSINVSIMKAPLDFSKDFQKHGYNNIQVNPYIIEQYSNSQVLKKIYDIINDGNYNHSDIMTDYFDIKFFVHINIGKWDKPYIQTK